MKRQGIRLFGINPPDINHGNLNLILATIWELIFRYEVRRVCPPQSHSISQYKQYLLDWLQLRLEPYYLKVSNFRCSDWKDGRVISALVDSYKPGSLQIEGDPLSLATTAMTFAEKEFQIPMILDPNDLVDDTDTLSILTYLTLFKKYLENEDMGDEIIQYVDDFKFVLVGQGLKEGKVGYEKAFTVSIYNKLNNEPTSVQMDFKISGSEEVVCSFYEVKPGNIKCYYKVLTNPGDYSVEIFFGNKLVDKIIVPWLAPPGEHDWNWPMIHKRLPINIQNLINETILCLDKNYLPKDLIILIIKKVFCPTKYIKMIDQ